MSTRYAWMSEPVHTFAKAVEIYEDARKNVFNNQETSQLQMIAFGHNTWAVAFCTRESSNENPYDTFYSLGTACERWTYITDEQNGGYLT